MASSDVPAGDDRAEVIPSAVDPDVECVRIDKAAGQAEPPPSPPPDAGPEGRRLCPEGYVPRRRRRDYTLNGKRVVTGTPPTRNPEEPRAHGTPPDDAVP